MEEAFPSRPVKEEFSFREEMHPLIAHLFQIPGLEKLVPNLVAFLSSDGTCLTKKTETDFAAIMNSYNTERSKYLKQRLSVTFLEEILDEYDLKQEDDDLEDSDENKAFKILRDALLDCQLENHLHLLGNETNRDIHLLNLFPNEIQRSKLSQDTEQFLTMKMEEHLLSKCSNLLQTLESKTNIDALPMSDRLKMIMQLPEMVRTMIDNMKEIEEFELQDDDEFKSLMDAYVRYFKSLENLASKHSMGDIACLNKAMANYFHAKVKTLLQKLRSRESEVKAETYKADNVVALKKIKHHLAKQITETSSQIDKTKGLLKQYEAAGEELEAIVVEYADVQKDIESKKWALDELRKPE